MGCTCIYSPETLLNLLRATAIASSAIISKHVYVLPEAIRCSSSQVTLTIKYNILVMSSLTSVLPIYRLKSFFSIDIYKKV